MFARQNNVIDQGRMIICSYLCQHLIIVIMALRKVYLGSDHAGFTLKTSIKTFLQENAYDVIDVGTAEKVSCHYPDYAEKMAKLMKPQDRGVLVCGSGIGVCMAAVKAGLTCCTVYNEYLANEASKSCQVIALGQRVVPLEAAKSIIKQFLGKIK